MKNTKAILLALTAATLSFEASAAIRTNDYMPHRVHGYKSGQDASEKSAKAAAEKKAHAKAKGIAEDKLVFPKEAKHRGMPINMEGRIESLCGYEIGSIAKLPRHPKLDDDGNIVVVEKLKKPFRKCTQVELKYSKVNHALYYIRLFSTGQKKMDDDAAWSELETISDAIKTKFGAKIASWCKSNSSSLKICSANLNLLAFQSLEVRAFMGEVEKRVLLKGGADSRTEKGWAFSMTLIDRAMQGYDSKEKNVEKATTSDVDVL